MRQKGKADACEEIGETSRELVYLLGSLRSDDEGLRHELLNEREGSSWLLTKDDLEKETDSLREEELKHKIERHIKIYWCDKMKEIFLMCWKISGIFRLP